MEVWARREGEGARPMGWEGAGRKAEKEPGRVEGSSVAGRGGIRRSEKAKLPEEAYPMLLLLLANHPRNIYTLRVRLGPYSGAHAT